VREQSIGKTVKELLDEDGRRYEWMERVIKTRKEVEKEE
jgi:hypothetical protein